MSNTILWEGYEFDIWRFLLPGESGGRPWPDEPGVYILVNADTHGNYSPLYVGETDSFRTRFRDHEKWDRARDMGMNQVHLRIVDNQNGREALELHLIRVLQPPLNEQHR